METTTLLIWTRLFVNEAADDATEADVASIEVYQNTDGRLEQFSTPVNKELKVEEWGLEAVEWYEQLERYLIELPVKAEEFNHELLELYAPFSRATYNGEEVEVEDGNGTCWGGNYRIDEDGSITEVNDFDD